MSTPSAHLIAALAPWAISTPSAIPRAEPTTPTMAASPSTELSTWPREAPSARSRASSRARCPMSIEKVLTMMNAPTNRATPAKTRRKVVKKPRPCWTASSLSASTVGAGHGLGGGREHLGDGVAERGLGDAVLRGHGDRGDRAVGCEELTGGRLVQQDRGRAEEDAELDLAGDGHRGGHAADDGLGAVTDSELGLVQGGALDGHLARPGRSAAVDEREGRVVLGEREARGRVRRCCAPPSRPCRR